LKSTLSAAAEVTDQESFSKALRENVKSTRSVEMDITQERVLLAFQDKLTSTGKFYLEMPDKLRWQVDKPYGSAIVYNREQVAKFERKNNRWQRLDHGGADVIKQIMSQISDWTQGNFNQNELYNITFLMPNKVTLTPKSKEMQAMLSQIDLEFDTKNYLIKTVVLKELGGDYVKIAFSNPKLNTTINRGLFATSEKDANR
jgi:outer membrane lipoprotein-sorting protein